MFLSTNVLLGLYEQMLLVRKFEERAGQLYSMGEIGGFCHLYIGQEAVAVGVEHCITDSDSVITSYRDHAAMIVRGSHIDSVMAELMGRSDGASRGKGGSMHIFDRERNFFGGHGIVGSQTSLGTGLGFAHKYRGTDNISVVYLGDGAVQQGQFYESMNIAALWGLPVLYLIENNQYGMGTAVKRVAAGGPLHERGVPFGIPGRVVDGMDLFSVIETVSEVVASMRENSSPVIIEFETYRFKGHSVSDPAKYRAKEELDSYKSRDPIESLYVYLVRERGLDEENLHCVQKKVKQLVMECVERCKNSPLPDSLEVFTNIYS